MKCNEVRNVVLAYLDSELDAKTSQEIQLHLQNCAECADLFAREEKFDERLFAVLRAGQATLAVWERVESRLQPAGRIRWLIRRWKWAVIGGVAVAGAALLLVSVGVFRQETASLDLASAVKPDHAKYVAGQLKPQFATQPSAEAIAKERGRLDAEAFAKLPRTPGFRSEGKRICHLSNVPVAWTFGRDEGLPVSIVVLRRSELSNFPQLRKELEAGQPVVCVRAGRFHFAARVVGEHVVCAIAATSREWLENLVTTVPNRPDAG